MRKMIKKIKYIIETKSCESFTEQETKKKVRENKKDKEVKEMKENKENKEMI